MTVEHSTDASLTNPTDWKSIDWITINRLVRRLQMRIAKAEQTGRHRKIKSLQWLLTHSHAAKLLAVHRVTTNRGAKTPGVDNVVWRSQRQKLQAAELLNRCGYRPKPLRRHYIPKKNGKFRPLSIPTLYDRAMQALYALALAPIAETVADPYSYGFREGRCCADALEHAHIVLSKRTSPPWVLEGDIRACFDQISQDWLLQHVPMDKQILSKWLKAGYLEKGKWFPTKEGTPQGGLISPLLANLALDGMQKAIRQAVRAKGDKVHFMRYADDFIVTGATKELLEQKVKPAVTAFLQPRGLELSEQKTVITHIQDGFNFLGHTVRRYGDKLLTIPKESNVKSLREKIRLCLQSTLALGQKALIRKLNPILRGWANFYRHAAAKATFDKLDHYVHWRIWRWTKRRHSNKSAQWRKDKYYSAAGDGWKFSVRYLRKSDGKLKVMQLYRLGTTPILRYIKVKGAANPYDPKYTEYFDRRRSIIWRVRGNLAFTKANSTG